MGFEIAWGSPATIWCPVDSAGRSYDVAYVGQLVQSVSDGVANLGQATGIAGTGSTPKKIPYGVVVGTNLRTPSFDTTYKAESITSVDPHGQTTEYVLHGGSGKTPVGETAAYVNVALIDPCTVLKGRIFNAAYGTAITAGVVTTGSTTGAGFTCSAGLSDASTPVADLGTVYCRSGVNGGIYRVTTDTSATVKTVDMYFPYDIAVGDTFVNVQIRPWGHSFVQTDTEATYFNAAANPATDYWIIDVIALDLSVAGAEYVEFRFNADHFARIRA